MSSNAPPPAAAKALAAPDAPCPHCPEKAAGLSYGGQMDGIHGDPTDTQASGLGDYAVHTLRGLDEQRAARGQRRPKGVIGHLAPIPELGPAVRAWNQARVPAGVEVAEGDVLVLRADWLVQRRPCEWVRCQELPPEALVPHTGCEFVYFVSHRWEAKNHPDPRNEQALLLALFLVARFTPDELTRVGLW